MLNIIACIDKSTRGIGIGGKLLYNIPEDMHLFKQKTKGNIVICGRKTLDGFKFHAPLPGRTNIVVTSNSELDYGDACYFMHDIKECIKLAKVLSRQNEVWVVGGESVYSAFLPHADILYLTEVEQLLVAQEHRAADTFFPRFKHLYNETGRSLVYNIKCNGEELRYQFVQYRNQYAGCFDLEGNSIYDKK